MAIHHNQATEIINTSRYLLSVASLHCFIAVLFNRCRLLQYVYYQMKSHVMFITDLDMVKVVFFILSRFFSHSRIGRGTLVLCNPFHTQSEIFETLHVD